ncbi:MAG: hypothetical protein ACREOU_03055 [Candidatus Eiseniibacteriota bacterium]
MVTLAWALAGALALAPADSADSTAPPDSGAAETLEALELEEAWFESGEEPDEIATAPARGFASAGRLLWARGGAQLVTRWSASRVRLDALVAREPGEPRAVDDIAWALALAPRPWLTVSIGRVLPMVGAGLLLGPRRAGTSRTPSFAGRSTPSIAPGEPPLTSPARAATGFRGLWAFATRGAWRLGMLVADTPRDARASGLAWLPTASTRHRDAEESSRRGRLTEQLTAFAIAREGVWALVAISYTGPRRVQPLSTSQAAETAAPVHDGGGACELGFAIDGTPRASGALAFDSGGRARTRLALEARTSEVIADLAAETEASGFTPLRALPERRAHLRAVARLRGHRRPWSVEAHLAERSSFDPARVWLALRLGPVRNVDLALRRDSAPKRTVVAVSAASAVSSANRTRARITLRGGVELRFDPKGLLRETWRIAGIARAPGSLLVEAEARMGSGRGSTATAEPDLPGGGFTRWSGGSARTRLEIRRTGRLAPWLAALRTVSATGTANELRMGLDWVAGTSSPGTL